MKRQILFAAALVLVAGDAFSAVTSRYLVATRGPAPETIRLAIEGEESTRIVRPFRSVNGFAVELTEQQAIELERSSWVEFVEPDPERYASGATSLPDLPFLPSASNEAVPYGIDLVTARSVWPAGHGAGIRVGVCDTGLDTGHPDISARFRGGYDFVDQDTNPQDGDGHGTHVAGIIAASLNDEGVVGVAPDVEIYALRVLDSNGRGNSSDLIDAIDWAIDHDLNILNMSLGSSVPSTLEERAIQRAIEEGLIVVAASGNDGDLSVEYPGAYPGVIATGAVDRGRNLAGFSTRGSALDLVAPGVGVLSTYPRGQGTLTAVQATAQAFEAHRLLNSPTGRESARFVYCGIGRPQDFPGSVRGRIALIQRGELTFAEKSANAKSAGALAVVIFNNVAAGDASNWTLGSDPVNWLLTVGISYEDGQELLKTPTDTITVTSGPGDYAVLDGTSMATPHVAGVAALVWSLDPNAPAALVQSILLATATDLGEPGFDTTFGHGLVDALAAAKLFAPQRFNPPGPRRRAVH